MRNSIQLGSVKILFRPVAVRASIWLAVLVKSRPVDFNGWVWQVALNTQSWLCSAIKLYCLILLSYCPSMDEFDRCRLTPLVDFARPWNCTAWFCHPADDQWVSLTDDAQHSELTLLGHETVLAEFNRFTAHQCKWCLKGNFNVLEFL